MRLRHRIIRIRKWSKGSMKSVILYRIQGKPGDNHVIRANTHSRDLYAVAARIFRNVVSAFDLDMDASWNTWVTKAV